MKQVNIIYFCLNKKIDPCQSNFNMRPSQCDYKLWKESGCSDKGHLNPLLSNNNNRWDNFNWNYNKKKLEKDI